MVYKKEIKLDENQETVLAKRYLIKDSAGKPAEKVSDLFERVASYVAKADRIYDPSADVDKTAQTFYDMMANFDFMPNSPTLMNAGRELGQLSACFVLPIDDSMDSIFQTIQYTAMIHKSGGGTGFSFSRLRPKNDAVKSTSGISSGPVSFMQVYNVATEAIKQGGTRRGANMGILRVDHPDIMGFIDIKKYPDKKNSELSRGLEQIINQCAIVLRQDPAEITKRLDRMVVEGRQLNNFNLSVGLTNQFLKAFEENGKYPLVNPSTGKVVNEIYAKEVFDRIVENAWSNGEPGIIFLDRMNEANPTPALGAIESTNPCGEQPLLSHESCNLGSVNLANMLKNEGGKKVIDWEKLEKITRQATHFMDNVIDMNKYPPVYIFEPIGEETYKRINPIERMTKGNRKLGLGVMGLADMLIQMKVPYNSDDGIKIGEKVMKCIKNNARIASKELASQRGTFPNFKDSIYDKNSKNFKGEDLELRNATLTTIAPTGTISMIAASSGGIEPIFDITYIKTNVLEKNTLLYFNPYLEQALIDEKQSALLEKMDKIKGAVYDSGNKELMKILNDVKKDVPAHIKDIFVTAHDIKPEDHIRMQTVFQKHTDNAVSKTINFPKTATKEDVEKGYLLAYRLGCKGLTVYVDQSRGSQVYERIEFSEENKEEKKNGKRPKQMLGITRRERIGTEDGQGSLFVTMNFRENSDLEKIIEHLIKKEELIEVFFNSDVFDDRVYSAMTVLGKMLSRGMRKGKFDIKFAVSCMEKLPAGELGYDEGFSGGTPYANNNYIEAIKKCVTNAFYPPLLLPAHAESAENPKKKEKQPEFSENGEGKHCEVCRIGILENKEGCIKCNNPACGESPKGCGG